MTEVPAQRSYVAVVKTHILWVIRENINNNHNDNKGKPGEERSRISVWVFFVFL